MPTKVMTSHVSVDDIVPEAAIEPCLMARATVLLNSLNHTDVSFWVFPSHQRDAAVKAVLAVSAVIANEVRAGCVNRVESMREANEPNINVTIFQRGNNYAETIVRGL